MYAPPKLGLTVFSATTICMMLLSCKNDVHFPQLDPQCQTFFDQQLKLVMLRCKNHVRSPKIGSPMSDIFLPTTKYGIEWMQK